MDFKTAFLHEDLQEDVFLKQTPSFESEEFPNHVYRLDKAVYGLKQTPRAQYDTMANYLLMTGQKHNATENIMFIKKSGSHIILAQVYVDVFIFGSTNETMSTEFAEVMDKKFEISMMDELTFFLGLQVKQLADGIFTYQANYVINLQKMFGFSNSKPTKTPMTPLVSLSADPNENEVNITVYR